MKWLVLSQGSYRTWRSHLQAVIMRQKVKDTKYKGTYSKTCHKRPLKKKTRIGFQDRLSLNTGQKYCRMLQESILQYFRPSLSYHLSLRPLLCLFLSGRLRQILLYMNSLELLNLLNVDSTYHRVAASRALYSKKKKNFLWLSLGRNQYRREGL